LTGKFPQKSHRGPQPVEVERKKIHLIRYLMFSVPPIVGRATGNFPPPKTGKILGNRVTTGK
jgi:hypothetical protein